MNEGIISGNLTREPETVDTNSDYSCIKFSIANNDERKKDESGNYQEVVNFFDCEFWTRNPQYWLNKLFKGTGVVLGYKSKQNRWEKDGQKRSKVVFVVQRFPLILEKKSDNQTDQQPASKPPTQSVDNFENDCPF